MAETFSLALKVFLFAIMMNVPTDINSANKKAVRVFFFVVVVFFILQKREKSEESFITFAVFD